LFFQFKSITNAAITSKTAKEITIILISFSIFVCKLNAKIKGTTKIKAKPV